MMAVAEGTTRFGGFGVRTTLFHELTACFDSGKKGVCTSARWL